MCAREKTFGTCAGSLFAYSSQTDARDLSLRYVRSRVVLVGGAMLEANHLGSLTRERASHNRYENQRADKI